MTLRAQLLNLLHRLLRVPPPEPVVVVREVVKEVYIEPVIHRMSEYGFEGEAPMVIPEPSLPQHPTLQ